MPLPDCLKEQDGGGYRHVERVEAPQHGDADMRIGSASPLVSESRRFCAHDDGGTLGHGRVVVEA